MAEPNNQGTETGKSKPSSKLEWSAPKLEMINVESTAGKPKMWPNEFNPSYGITAS